MIHVADASLRSPACQEWDVRVKLQLGSRSAAPVGLLTASDEQRAGTARAVLDARGGGDRGVAVWEATLGGGLRSKGGIGDWREVDWPTYSLL